jgi:hypothetical protein
VRARHPRQRIVADLVKGARVEQTLLGEPNGIAEAAVRAGDLEALRGSDASMVIPLKCRSGTKRF